MLDRCYIIKNKMGNYADWFISNEYTKQGKWYLGVASMDKNSNIKNQEHYPK